MAETKTAPKTDPWADDPSMAKSAPGGSAMPTSGDDDWKIWQDQGEQPQPQQSGNTLQRAFDSFVTPRMAEPNETTGAHILRGAENVGRGVVGGAIGPLVHPLDTLKTAADMAQSGTSPYQSWAEPMVRSLVEHPEEGTESLVGNMAGGALAGKGIGLAGDALGAVGRGGLELGNNALGARGAKPFKYGANPARGAYEEGVLPAMSKHSAAMKLESALPDVGKRISEAVMNSGGEAPAPAIAHSIETPITEAGNVMSGFGGGKPLDPVTNLWVSMENKAPNAKAPIYGPNAPTSVPAPDLWRSIQNLDRNTRFNPDPEVEGVNELRRDMRGGLRGNLEDAVPGLSEHTQPYQDLKSAQDTLDRTMHSGTGLHRAMDFLKFPVESTVGRAMYGTGKAAPLVHELAPTGPVSSLIHAFRDEKKKEQ